MILFRCTLLIVLVVLINGCKLGAQQKLVDGIVLKTQLKPALGGGYKQKVIYRYNFEGVGIVDSVINGRSVSYAQVGDSLIVKIWTRKGSVTQNEIIEIKKANSESSLSPVVKLNSDSDQKSIVNEFENSKKDTVITVYGKDIKSSSSDKPNFMYELLEEKPYMIGFKDDLTGFFAENTNFSTVESAESVELYFSFIVTDEGKARDIDVLSKTVSEPVLEQLKKTLEKMPEWKPGSKNGEPVNTIIFLKLYY